MGKKRYLPLGVILTSVSCLPAQPVSAVDAAKKAIEDIQADQNKAKTIVLADIAYKLSQNGSSSLAYAAIQLQGAKDAKRVTDVFTEANVKGDALEFVNRDQTLKLIKMGPVNSALVDKVDDFTKAIEQGTVSNIPISEVPVEAAMTALLGSFDKLPTGVQDQAIRSFAKMEGKDFDTVVSDVRFDRILKGTASDPKAPVADEEKKIDQRIYDDGISLVNKQLLENANAANSPAVVSDADKKKDLEKDEAHVEAGVFLAETLLTTVVSPASAHQIQTAGTAFTKMYDAMQRFGPGGLTPDKLLMCTNMVSAGLVVAQLFTQTEDPTRAALSVIMDQLKAINAKLEEIDKKLDRLTDLTIEGFDRVLHDEHYTQAMLQKFSDVFQANIKEQTQKTALDEYLQYLRQDVGTYKEFLQCDSTLKEVPADQKECIENLALDFAGRRIFTGDQGPTTPRILDPTWVNYLLSYTDIQSIGGQLVLSQLSAPFFFLGVPAISKSELARDHEAVASAAHEYFGSPHPSAVPNPEILLQRLNVLLAASRNFAVFKSRNALPLTEEALARIAQLETFVSGTIGSESAMDTVWQRLGDLGTKAQAGIALDVREVMQDPYLDQRKAFDNNTIGLCEPHTGIPAYPLPLPANADQLVPPIYWLATDLGLGHPKMCVEFAKAVLVVPPNIFQFIYRVKTYFELTDGAVDQGSLGDFEKTDASPREKKNNVLISSKTIRSHTSYSTFNDYTYVLYYRAWGGSRDGLNAIHECYALVDVEDPPKPRPPVYDKNHKQIPPAKTYHKETQFVCKDNPDAVFKRVVADGAEELSGPQIQQAQADIKKAVKNIIGSVLTADYGVWDPTVLATKASSTSDKFLRFDLAKGKNYQSLLNSYSMANLAAQDLLMLAAYHGETISGCLQSLREADPPALMALAVDQAAEGKDLTFGRDLVATMRSHKADCGHAVVDPEIALAKTRLEAVHKRELNSTTK
jgi:hypothetical protein